MDEELLPCPFCRSDDVEITCAITDDGSWWVECNQCESGGPDSLTKKGAAEVWNTRNPQIDAFCTCDERNCVKCFIQRVPDISSASSI